MKLKRPSPFAQILILSAFLHICAALFTLGYQNSDEHFQILEFLFFKMGLRPDTGLPLEHGLMLRSWLQPALYFPFVSLARALGDANPFHWALIIRLLSSVIGFASVIACVKLIPRFIQEQSREQHAELWQKVALLASCFLWYLPVFHARHSSENVGGALFLIGLSFFLLGRSFRSHLIAGVILCAAFFCRFQIGVMIAGLLAWAAWAPRRSLSPRRSFVEWGGLGTGFVLCLLSGILIDTWGYGTITFTPWNYFRFNLLEGQVNAHDVSPWWDYLRRSWTESTPLLGTVQFLALLVVFVRYPKHVLTWTHLPLLLIHTLIPHKETRFIFPLFHSGGLFLALALMSESETVRWFLRFLTRPALVLNAVVLVGFTFTPVWFPIRFYEQVYELAERNTTGAPVTVYFQEHNPYEVLGIPLYLYRPPHLTVTSMGSTPPPEGYFLALPHDEPLSGCESLFSSYPAHLSQWMYQNLKRRINDWTLYRCGRPLLKS